MNKRNHSNSGSFSISRSRSRENIQSQQNKQSSHYNEEEEMELNSIIKQDKIKNKRENRQGARNNDKHSYKNRKHKEERRRNYERGENRRNSSYYNKYDSKREKREKKRDFYDIERKKRFEEKLVKLPEPYSVWLKQEDQELSQSYKKNVQFLEEDKEHPECNFQVGNIQELNAYKDKLDDVQDWNKYRFFQHDFELVDIQRTEETQQKRYALGVVDYGKRPGQLKPVFSGTYFKLWEILCQFDVLKDQANKPITIGSIASGPGGFIQCLIDYRNKEYQKFLEKEDDMTLDERKDSQMNFWTKDKHVAITEKMLEDDKFIADWDFAKAKKYFELMDKFKYDIKLSYGTGDGNILIKENQDYFQQKDLQNEKCQLVTSDGGVQVTRRNYNFQELASAKLFFAESLLAMKIQEKGGTFILKIFDSVYDVTLQVLQLLCVHYKSVRIVKPLISREASSERYLLCEGFLGIEQEQIEILEEILGEWKETEIKVEDYLGNEKKVKNILDFDENDEEFAIWRKEMFYFNLKDSNEDCFKRQISKINEGIDLVKQTQEKGESWLRDYKKKRVKEQEIKSASWCDQYNIPYY